MNARLPITVKVRKGRASGPVTAIGSWILLVTVASMHCSLACDALAQAPASAPEGELALREERRLVGVGSCTAAGCHGGGSPDRVIGSEYNVWIAQDRHARAYSTLFDERSQRMVRLLDGLDPEAQVAPHKDDRCLACHSMSDAKPVDPRRDVVSDGVGCEACHGPAEDWLASHLQRPFSNEDKQRAGFWNTDSIVVRTQTCVRCHVGGRSRDVNHDLIAAGHPRLQFDMGAYLDAMPRHWDETKDRAGRDSDFDALVWAIGQACTSQAALGQLASRADSDSVAKAWPEFAEWSCAACHHALQPVPPEQSRSRESQASPGRLIEWDTWNHFAVREQAVAMSTAFSNDRDSIPLVQDAMVELTQEMQQLNPDRRKVAALARSTASELGRWAMSIDESRIDRQQLDSLTQAILAAQLEKEVLNWDTAAQTYNAMASLHESRLRTSGENAELTAAIRKFYENLAALQQNASAYQVPSEPLRRQLMEVRRHLGPVESGQ